MGRIDTNATQYHQGLQFQEFHQGPAETIDDAPPPADEDLYEPPPADYQPESAGMTNTNPPLPPQAFPPPPPHEPQPFPPTVHSFPPPPTHEDYDKPTSPQPFPPPQQDPNIHSFPPPHQDHEKPPPAQHFHPQAFSPNIPSGNQYIHPQQQQPMNMGMQYSPQIQAFPLQPVAGGIPVGVSPSPLVTQQNQPWKTHLFDCMKNPQNAIITLFFPCVTFGQIAEILDSGSTSCGTSGMLYSLIACCIAMPCIMSCTYRTKLRSKFGLVESPAPDWVIHCFCECCALCQEYRELEERGYDPSIGWLGNQAKQQQKQQYGLLTPPMQQRMM